MLNGCRHEKYKSKICALLFIIPLDDMHSSVERERKGMTDRKRMKESKKEKEIDR